MPVPKPVAGLFPNNPPVDVFVFVLVPKLPKPVFGVDVPSPNEFVLVFVVPKSEGCDCCAVLPKFPNPADV